MTMPTMVKCCQKTMCFECITMTITQMNKCPYCRSQLTTKDLIVMSSDTSTSAGLDKFRTLYPKNYGHSYFFAIVQSIYQTIV